MSAENSDDVLQNADQLFDENKFQEAVEILKKHPVNFHSSIYTLACVLCHNRISLMFLLFFSSQNLFKQNQNDANVLWREARALYKLSSTNKDKGEKEKNIRDGYELIVKALELDDKNYACHKWMAVLLDAKSDLDGIKARVTELETVKKHMEKAVELNPEDPTNWHLLGNFAYGLADMPWYQRKIVSTIFATPPTGTYEEALDYFLKAEDKKPGFYSMNLLFIGKCYYNLKDKDKAKEFLTKASEVQVV